MNIKHDKIVFTLCSNNYLAQAKTLGDSVFANNPDYHFIIGLVDRRDAAIDYNFFDSFEIIEVEKIGIPYLDELWKKYNIVELNTAVKPHYIDYIHRNSVADIIIYLDPDIIVFNNFSSIEEELSTHDVVLSPHFCSPQKDNLNPSDYDMLRTGVYNLGFLALKTTDASMKLCMWWKEKLKEMGQADLSKGLFTDQVWMHYTPCFTNTKISKHLGYNVANWNLHERRINKNDNVYMVNDKYPLIFFHFSNYRLVNPELMATYNNRYTLANRPDASVFFDLFRKLLTTNRHEQFIEVVPYFTQIRIEYLATLTQKEKNNLRFSPTIKRVIKRALKLF